MKIEEQHFHYPPPPQKNKNHTHTQHNTQNTPRDRAGDRSAEGLEQGRVPRPLELKNVFLHHGGAAEERERPGGVPGGGPPRPAVEASPLLPEDVGDAAAGEALRVGLRLDLENV